MVDRKATLTAVLVDAVSPVAARIRSNVTSIGTSAGGVAGFFRDLGASGRFGGLIQDLALGRSATAALSDATTGLRERVHGLAAAFRGLGSSILSGIGLGIGLGIFNALRDGIDSVIHAIPNVLAQGHNYLSQLQQIQFEIGGTAEQVSTLYGAFRALGVPTETITQSFAQFARQLATNEGRFRELGVATRDSNGVMLDAYQIFTNLRQQVAAHGSSLLSTAAIQELFGRSGYKMVEALQASNAEWAEAEINVRRWGGVVSQAAIAGADRLQDTLASLSQGITDIGVNIAAAVDPYLRAFVDSFARFVQAHLNEIINFAVGVVNTVTGFISGLFGITDSLDTSATSVAASTTKASAATDDWGKKLSTAKTGSDAFTDSLNRQIKAIDAHIEAIESAGQRRRATQERQRLADSLAAAQAQLADLRGNSPFLSGLSAAEQTLAVQKHAQDIIDAEKNVQDQRQAIGDFEADQKDRAETELLRRQKDRLQERLAAAKAANAEELTSGLRMAAGLETGVGTVLGNLGLRAQEFGKTAAASFRAGVDAAKGFLNVLLGAEHYDSTTNTYSRTGGLIGAIGAVGEVLGAIGGAFRFVGDVIRIFVETLGIMAQRILTLITRLMGISPEGRLITGGGFGGGIFRVPSGVPSYATGGMVAARPGGTVVRVGEGGEDEWIVPASRMGAGGQTLIVNVYNDFLSTPTDDQIRDVTDKISRRLAFTFANSPVSSLARS